MGKRKILWFLCFLAVFLVASFVLIPLSPVGKYQTLYAEDISQPTEEIIIATLINNVRNTNGVENLCYNETLAQIADIRARDMIERHYFGHYTPEKTTVFKLMNSWGIKAKYRGENLARGHPPEYATPENVVNAWMQSESHKYNLLRIKYRKIGVGIEVREEEKIIVLVFTN